MVLWSFVLPASLVDLNTGVCEEEEEEDEFNFNGFIETYD